MNDDGWITDPKALQTIIALRGVRAGDMVREQQLEWTSLTGGEYRVEISLISQVVEHFHECYQDGVDKRGYPKYREYWCLVGWKPKQHS